MNITFTQSELNEFVAKVATEVQPKKDVLEKLLKELSENIIAGSSGTFRQDTRLLEIVKGYVEKVNESIPEPKKVDWRKLL